MAVYVAQANPDKVTEGVQNVDHTLQFPFIDSNAGAQVTLTVSGSGTIKFNARGNASESDDDVASGQSRTVHVYKEISFRKTNTADSFTYEVNSFMS
jgi:hypothetical protein